MQQKGATCGAPRPARSAVKIDTTGPGLGVKQFKAHDFMAATLDYAAELLVKAAQTVKSDIEAATAQMEDALRGDNRL
jgi:hypothetical protein